jgi:hypothetical protein
MIKLAYRLEPHHLASYQYAVRAKLLKMKGEWWLSQPVQAVAVLSFAFAMAALANAVLPLMELPFDPLSGLAGYVIGITSGLLAQWLHYWACRRQLVRPDGPTLAPHEIELNETGVIARSPKAEAHYRWTMFEAATSYQGVHVLWFEPAAGVVVPRSAFASSDDDAAFLAYASERIQANRRPPS